MTGNQTSALETQHIESKGHRAGELVLLEACLLLVAANSYYYSIFVCTHAEKSLRCCYVSQIRCTSLCPSSNATAVCTKFSHQASARRPFHQYHRIPTSTGNEIPSVFSSTGTHSLSATSFCDFGSPTSCPWPASLPREILLWIGKAKVSLLKSLGLSRSCEHSGFPLQV